MLNSIADRRIKLEDRYKLYLDIPEKEYMITYNNEVNENNAKDILKQFLKYHQDDGRVENVKIKHDKNNNIINIQADMRYTDNYHTDQNNIY